jgi:hypothetical protein
MYAPVSATRYFTGALVAESRVNVTIPALHDIVSPIIDAPARKPSHAHDGCRGAPVENEAGIIPFLP